MSDAIISVPVSQLATLAIEHWRLSTAFAEIPTLTGPRVRHALRKIEDFLKSHQVESRSLDGLPYDPGLSAKVVDTLQDALLPAGSSVITETLSPLVLHQGTVLRPAEVVISTNA